MTKVTITIEGGSSGQPSFKATAMGDRTGVLLCSKAMKKFGLEVVGLKTTRGRAVGLETTIEELAAISGGTLVALFEGDPAATAEDEVEELETEAAPVEVTWLGEDPLELKLAVRIIDGEGAMADSGVLTSVDALKVRVLAQAIRYGEKAAAKEDLLLLILGGKPAVAHYVKLFADEEMRTEVEMEEQLPPLPARAPAASEENGGAEDQAAPPGVTVYAQLDLAIRVHLPGDGKRPTSMPQLCVTAIGGRQHALWSEKRGRGFRDDVTGDAVVAVANCDELEDAIFDWECDRGGKDVAEVSVEKEDEELREDLRKVVRGCCRDWIEDECPEEVEYADAERRVAYYPVFARALVRRTGFND